MKRYDVKFVRPTGSQYLCYYDTLNKSRHSLQLFDVPGMISHHKNKDTKTFIKHVYFVI